MAMYGPNSSTNDGSRLGRFLALLCVLVLSTHVYYLVVDGATFWVDINNFVLIGEALRSWAGLQDYYATTYPYWYGSHNGAGMGLVWLALAGLPAPWQWLVLSAGQHLLASVALIVVFMALYRCWPTYWHLVPCALLCNLPFYQVFHNMLMTESISGSLLLLGIAAGIEMLRTRTPTRGWWALLVVSILVLMQLRFYVGLMVTGIGGVVLLACGEVVSRRSLALAAAAALGFLAFPCYRWAATGAFFLPSLGAHGIAIALDANPNPSGKCVQAVERLASFPEGMPAAAVLRAGLDTPGLQALVESWRARGWSASQVLAVSRRMAHEIRADSRVSGLLHGIAGSGFIFCYRVMPRSWEVERGITAGDEPYRQLSYYRWQSWAADGYAHMFDVLFGQRLPQGGPSWHLAAGMVKAGLVERPAFLRDPLRLGRVFPDVWAALGVLGLAIVARWRPWLGVMFLGIVLLNVTILSAIPYGTVRYAYILVPVYLTAVSAAVGALRRRGGGAGHFPCSFTSEAPCRPPATHREGATT